MGLWDYVSGSVDLVKRSTPDLTPVKNCCSNSYAYSVATVCNIGSAVKSGVAYITPAEQNRSDIIRFSTILAKSAVPECLKFVPGGHTAYNVFNKSIKEMKKSEGHEVDIKALQDKVNRLEKEVDGNRKLQAKLLMDETSVVSTANGSLDSDGYPKPQDFINAFIEQQPIRRQFMDSLIDSWGFKQEVLMSSVSIYLICSRVSD